MIQTAEYILPPALETMFLLARDAWILPVLAEHYSCRLINRSGSVRFVGTPEEIAAVETVANELGKLMSSGVVITERQLAHMLEMLDNGKGAALRELHDDTVLATRSGKIVRPRTEGQKAYVDAIRNHTVTFGIGPAGTGKTYLAVALAVFYLRNHNVKRIILTRPAVEAGEHLGYLPGDLQEKVDPYLRPLYDALGDLFGGDVFMQLQAKGIIEVAPLAYMRGRTLEDCFVILDEAQNTTPEQMKMFLTRLGNNSKMVINGDVTQIDLQGHRRSGLMEAVATVGHLRGIARVEFTAKDVVRHDLVARIIDAYAKREERLARKGAENGCKSY